MKDWTDNRDKIAMRWSEGPNTVGGMIMRYNGGVFSLSLYDRNGTLIDSFDVE